MDLTELRTQVEQLPKLSPRTKVFVLRDTKHGIIRVPVFEIRYDGANVIIVEQYASW